MICDQRYSSTWSTAEQGRSTLFFVLRVRFQLTASISSPWRPRSREDEEVIGDHPEADPALHPIETPIPTPPEAMPALHHTDSPFTSGPPPQGPTKPALPLVGASERRQPAPLPQDHAPHAPGRGGLL